MAGCMKLIKDFHCMAVKLFAFAFILYCLPPLSHQATGSNSVVNLQYGVEQVSSGSKVFCYQNTIVPTWKHTWTRIQVKVWSSRGFKVHIVDDEEQLQELERWSAWGWFQSWLRENHNETSININLFKKKTCLKMEPVDGTKYTLKTLRKFDIYLFLVFLTGGLLFLFADSLSKSQLFYYSAGMSTGIIASLIILFFVLYRFMPKKGPFYLLVAGGWSFSIYAIQLVFRNLHSILKTHWHFVLGYVAVVGFISFAICYRYGPLVDEKSINILSWTLQLLGLILIYTGIQIQPVAFAIIVSLVLAKNLDYPVSLAIALWRKIRRFVNWKPEPRRLLTEEEYQRQGEEETRRALEELKQYCKSPEFNTWKTVSRLQSPQRFADFIEGSSHLMPNEVSVHSQEYGFGGSFFEEDIFDTDDEDDVKPIIDPE
ncbi:nuclear envelope integral membrane protein 1 [Periophthalmus magnuspinnatus]|uniref:nuclear envelope integral membrane protein 1 n=1 Tax=Periophthalmus magnuspinnatus TaxID=409849 RepID=UPI00145A5F8C|nr:nuclear envelope integral membrane protein 1 [Periophthalmus magnuspinnatus]